MLLEAFAAISEKYANWNLRLIGSIEKEFEPYINNYFDIHPELKNRVTFPGVISDRSQLEKEYANAKIFCLPSAYEGFALAAVEALSRGCYIIGSDIPSNVQITEHERFGTLFKNGDLQDFIDKLDYVLGHEEIIDANKDKAIQFAEKHYYWKDAIRAINDWVSKKLIR